MKYEDKIQKLKSIYKDSNEALEQIKSWEDKMLSLKVQRGWLEMENTQELKELAKDQIKRISQVLSSKEDITEIERRGLFAEKKAHTLYLSLLSDDPEEEIKSITRQVNEEL